VGDVIVAHFDLVDAVAPDDMAAFVPKRCHINFREAKRRCLGVEEIDNHHDT